MKKLASGKLVLVLIVVIALMSGVMVGFFLLPAFSPRGGAANAAYADSAHTATEALPARREAHTPGMMYPIKERVLNLTDASGMQYIKIELALEFDVPDARELKGEAYKKRQDELGKEMAPHRPIIDDIVTMTVSSKTAETLVKAEGKQALRDELKTKLSEAAGKYRLVNIYFTQFIIQ